jgi:hypothetical protein
MVDLLKFPENLLLLGWCWLAKRIAIVDQHTLNAVDHDQES